MNWLTSRCAPLAALAALALASCDKGTDLNVDLPDTTAINTEYKDLSVDVATVRLAPVQTLKADHFLVGRLADNVAGNTEARAYFNVIASSSLLSTADSLPATLPRPVLDSVVLVMGFDRVYGSATTPAKFDVFKLQDPLDERQVYDAGTATPVGDALGQNLTSRLDRTQQQIVTPAVAATTTTPAVPAVTTTVPDQSVRLLLQRRAFPATPGRPAIPAVPLPFATDLFARLSAPSFGQSQLDAALKGLAIAPSAGHNSSIVGFARFNKSRLAVYYHSADTLRRVYSIYFGPVYSGNNGTPSSDPRYYTQITNALPSALAVLADRPGAVRPDALNGSSYAQEGIGLGTRVTFTGLADLIKTAQAGNLTVNRAELRVPVRPFTNVLFPNPNLLYAVEVDGGNNVLQRIVNFTSTDRVVQADGSDQQGTFNPAFGVLDATTSQPYYSIPITNYLQAYLNDKLGGNPTSLVLVPNIRSSATLTLNRAALDAANIRLRVYYSKR